MRISRRRRDERRKIVLLGPQRLAPTARDVLEPLIEPDDSVAAVTAGWQERETEVDELAEHLGHEVLNLELYARSDDVFARDAELHEGLHQHHRKLHALRQLYRLRLRYLAPAAEELLGREGPDELLEPERVSAFEQLRSLDEHHLGRVAELRREFYERFDPAQRPAVAEHRAEIAERLAGVGALCIAGGHVRILLTRLRLFDVLGRLGPTTPVVAWSAGAMALTERVVLFHDSPPQGKGYAEVLGPGLGVCPGVVALPDARRRLHLDDAARVQLLSRRFPDTACVALDQRTELSWDGRSWWASEPTMRLGDDGTLTPAFAPAVN